VNNAHEIQLFGILQILDAFREPRIVPRYQRGVSCAASFLLIAIVAGIVLSSSQENLGSYDIVPFNIIAAFQIFAALAISSFFVTIKRRPDVFTPEGKLVERQYQSSLWTQYSYNWSSDILDLSATKNIEVSDLPAMDSHVRARDVKEAFKSIVLKPTISLWLQFFWAYRKPLVVQWFMMILSALVDAARQLSMLQLLQYLEARQGFDLIDPKAWFCVGSILFVTLAETLIECRVNWLMWSDLGVPIRSTATTLIYEKMMRIKDCKEPPKEEKEKQTKDGDKNTNGMDGKKADKPEISKADAAKKEAEKKKAQTDQDVINMFAVDTNSVGVFGAINQFYIMFLSKFVVSIAFLLLLVGWQSLLAGMLVIVLVYPINQWLAQRYGKVQKELMKARDKKSKVVSEAVQGIRQIKFSAIEPEWTKKINDAREEELVLLWQTKLNNLYMILGSDIAPIFLTVSALATYSWVHGELMPSVAFTALGIFMQLESILGMVPFLFMMGINAKVSCDRIDNFLRIENKPENTYPGDSITFDKVTVTFPSKSNPKDESEDEDEDEEAAEARRNRFTLRDLTFQFPNNELSIITGPTGAGKSLLLAAILGEVDVLNGSITAPRPPPIDQRFDSKATPANWLIPSAIAFASQTPWIENATIKDNILFGLPYEETRYNKVLKACALTDDLSILDDGDLTEVGAQGITLSGGQKWRLTLARALYSRAGILILDDVFSALDTHVGRHVYENAILGELAEGRTRILVTHHVALCLPGAKYAVGLSARGALEHAGWVTDLRRNSVFDKIEVRICDVLFSLPYLT
jgi:ABC-type multidrug transport system fused ATPase/permease subunit